MNKAIEDGPSLRGLKRITQGGEEPVTKKSKFEEKLSSMI